MRVPNSAPCDMRPSLQAIAALFAEPALVATVPRICVSGLARREMACQSTLLDKPDLGKQYSETGAQRSGALYNRPGVR